MGKISIRLRTPIVEKLNAYCSATLTTRVEMLSCAIKTLRGTRDRAHEFYREGLSPNFPWPANPRQYFEQLAPRPSKRVQGRRKEMLATNISDGDRKHLKFLADDFKITERQVIEAALLRELEERGYAVPDENASKLSEFWAKIGPCSEGEAVLCLLEEGGVNWHQDWHGLRLEKRSKTEDEPPQLQPKQYHLPEFLSGQTVLIDASLILVCLSQDELAQDLLQRVLKSPFSAVITSATVAEVAMKGSALVNAREDLPVEKMLRQVSSGNIVHSGSGPWSYRLKALIGAIPAIPIEPRDCAYALGLADISRTHYSRLVSLAAIHRVRKLQVVWMLRAIREPGGHGKGPVRFCVKKHDLREGAFRSLMQET